MKLSLASRPAPSLWARVLDRLLLADPRRALAWSCVAFVAVAVLDFVTPAQLNLTFGYVVVLVMVCWHNGARMGLAVAMLAFVLQVIGFQLAGDDFANGVLYSRIILWNRLFTFLVVVGLMAAIRSLYDRLERSRENLRAMSRHLVSLQEVERRRLASELHDCAGQQLAGLGINLDIVQSELPDGGGVADAVRTRLTYCKSCIDDMVDWMRGALDELRPSLLDSLGLVPALQKFARDLPRLAALQASVEVTGSPRALPRDLELALFRVVQESLINASRHSGANRAEVLLDYSKERLVVAITDHGRGFDVDAEPRAGRRGFGLLIMNERVTAAGASLRIDSAPGHGTRVTVAASIPREMPVVRAA